MASASEAADLEKKTRLETEMNRPLPPARTDEFEGAAAVFWELEG